MDTKINLRLDKSRKLDNAAHIMFAASVLSTIIIYHTPNKSAYPFLFPLSLAVGGMTCKVWSDHLDSD